MQDFLRIVCRNSAPLSYLQLFEDLQLVLKDEPAFNAFLESLKGSINHSRPSPGVLWDIHGELVNSLFANETSKSAISKVLSSYIPAANATNTHLTWLVSREKFADCYALNSLLVHIVLRYCREQKLGLEQKLSSRLRAVVSNHHEHDCGAQEIPKACVPFSHMAEYATTHENGSTIEANPYDVVVIRHGATQNDS
jgi:hypothetical protein